MLRLVRSWLHPQQQPRPSKSDLDGLFLSGTVAAEFGQDRLRVLVLRSADATPCEDCSGECLLLALGLTDPDGDWSPMVVMHESRLAVMQSVLNEVEQFLRSCDRSRPAEPVQA